MFISNFYGFLLDEFGMPSRRASFLATELSCTSYILTVITVRKVMCV